MPTIALLTDFGDADGFVGMMKGAILKICPQAQIVDMTHQIQSFDIRAGAFILQKSVRYLPEGTIFVAVVDPGVGGERKIIAASAGDYYFVAPDNGLLSYVLAELPDRSLVAVENQALYAPDPSRTFHGRDIMAPVAGHLANGLALNELGPELDSYHVLKMPCLLKKQGSVIGEIVYVDKFGNMISNISGADLPPHDDLSQLQCVVGNVRQVGFSSSYVAAEGMAATLSGMGTVEIFLNQDRAADRFASPIGTVVAITR